MKRLLLAEARRLSSVRALPGLLVATLVVEVAFRALLAGVQDTSGLQDRAAQAELLGPTLLLPLGCAAFGALLAGEQWRHRLAVGSFLVTPRRTPVLLAQALVAAAAGAVLALAATGTANLLCWVLLDQRVALRLDAADGWASVLGTVPAGALLAAGGVAAAHLLRSQSAALGAVTVVLLVLAPLTQVLVPDVAAYLPNGAALGLAGQEIAEPSYLPATLAGLLLLAQVAVLLGLAERRLRSRDI